MRKHGYNVVRVLPSMAGIAIVPKQVAPPSAKFPLLLHYAQEGPFTEDRIESGVLPGSQDITYVLRFIDQAEDDAKIRQPRRDAFEALVRDNAEAIVTTEDNETFRVYIDSKDGGEWTIGNDYYDASGRPFKQIGFYLICHVYRV